MKEGFFADSKKRMTTNIMTQKQCNLQGTPCTGRIIIMFVPPPSLTPTSSAQYITYIVKYNILFLQNYSYWNNRSITVFIFALSLFKVELLRLKVGHSVFEPRLLGTSIGVAKTSLTSVEITVVVDFSGIVNFQKSFSIRALNTFRASRYTG